FRAAQEIPVIQGTPHAILYPRKSVSSRLLPAGWSAAFLRLRRMKSAIRVFFLRHRGICPGAGLSKDNLYPAYVTCAEVGEQHAPSQANVTRITRRKLASFPSKFVS